MKSKILIVSVFLIVTCSSVNAQNKNGVPQSSIISKTAVIKKFYDLRELQGLNKGELITLYQERIKVLVKTLPYIALATRSGVSMEDLGIPTDSSNKKTFETQEAAVESFLQVTSDFQSKIMPYSDTRNLIAAILFYENTLKSLHELNDTGR